MAVARALVHEPAFVLADEPTGNLDSKSSAAVIDLLTGLNAHGTTIATLSAMFAISAMMPMRTGVRVSWRAK